MEKGKATLLQYSWASLVAELVKNLPAMRETWVRSLGWEDPLEKGTATHSSTVARRIPGLSSPWGRQGSDTSGQLAVSRQCSEAVISKPIRGVCLGLEDFVGKVWEGELVNQVKRQEGSSQRRERTGQVRECGGKAHGEQRTPCVKQKRDAVGSHSLG